MAITDHPELVGIIAELEDTPGDYTTTLRCRGGYHGKVVNGRWFVSACRCRHCRRPGHTAYHVWDIQTGEMRTHYDPPLSGPEENNNG